MLVLLVIFDLSDMDLSLTSLCEGSNYVWELLMDISFPLSSDSSCVDSAGSHGGSFSGSGGSGGGISVGSGSVLETVEAAVVSAAAVAEV